MYICMPTVCIWMDPVTYVSYMDGSMWAYPMRTISRWERATERKGFQDGAPCASRCSLSSAALSTEFVKGAVGGKRGGDQNVKKWEEHVSECEEEGGKC